MDIRELHLLLIQSARNGLQPFLRELQLAPLLKQSEAYRLFGRGNVERWLAEGLVVKDGKKYNRSRLENLAANMNRLSYLTVKARNEKLKSKVTHE